jgi:uncharacterized membrane protein
MGTLKEILSSSLLESFLFLFVDILISIALLFLLGFAFISILGLLLLIESAVLMLIGGALDFSRTFSGKKLLLFMRIRPREESEDKKTRSRAGIYTLTGVILFTESLLLAVIFY